MARIARVVVPGNPHHVIQRGNRRQQTFFGREDYNAYLGFMADWCRRCQVEIWAYCLLPNQVHLIATPETEDGLRRAIGEAHKRYSTRINTREGWRGHLWQGRFSSYPLDEHHLLWAARFIEMTPIYNGLAQKPEDYPWSSAPAHMRGRNDYLVKVKPLLEQMPNWGGFLLEPLEPRMIQALIQHEKTGRPLGDSAFLTQCENRLHRFLNRRKPGPKPQRGKEGLPMGLEMN